MDRNKTFCEFCRETTEYVTKDTTLKEEFRDAEYEFKGQIALCANCNEELFVMEIEKENTKALYEAYRKEKKIISPDKIIELLKKYGMTKRVLPKILGWGEHTISRYCDENYMPSKQYSDILMKIYNDPAYFKELLNHNKDKITDIAYKKSMEKLDSIIEKPVDLNLSVKDVAKYIIFSCEDITPLALQKILYFIQGFFYAFTNVFILDAECEAWAHGPVYREIYNIYAGYKYDPIHRNKGIDIPEFTDVQKAVIDSVINSFGSYSGKILERFTHLEPPWLEMREGLSPNDVSNRVIPKESIGEYFKAVKEKYNMLTPRDIEVYANNLFFQII